MFGISKERKKSSLKRKPEIVNKEVVKKTEEKKKEVTVTTFTKAYLEWNPGTRRMMVVLVATNGKRVKKVYDDADSPFLRDISDIFSEDDA